MIEEKRKTRIDIIGDVPWGTHFCQFYKTKDDLVDILVPYFKAGLENNEFCMWICWDPLRSEEAKNALEENAKDLNGYIAKGQIEIVDYSRKQIEKEGSSFSKMKQFWIDKEKQALENGFDGLRLARNTLWLEKKEWNDFRQYEAQVDEIIKKHKMLALCPYSLDKCGPAEMIDVILNHDFALIRRESKWELIENFERRQAEQGLAMKKALDDECQNISKDTVEHKQLNQKYTQFMAELIKADEINRMKNMFIASMSHELRTPLNSIIGFTGILLMEMAGKLNAEQKKQLEMIKSSSRHLLELINDVIDVSKIEAGEIRLSKEEFELERVINEARGSIAGFLNGKRVKLSVDFTAGLKINSDFRRVKQIILNLLTNAIKFTDQGKIIVETIRENNLVKVKVSDTGIGIKAENMDKIFKQFSRIISSERPLQEGTGLGLYLSQKLAGMLGGKITVQSEFGKGSVFTLELPA